MTASVISQKEPKAGTFENFVRKKNLEITILLDLNSKKVNNASFQSIQNTKSLQDTHRFCTEKVK